MNNGIARGGSPDHLETIHSFAKTTDLWQLHASRNEGARNAAEPYLANIDDGTMTSYSLRLSALEDDSFHIVNGRNGFNKAYPAPAAR